MKKIYSKVFKVLTLLIVFVTIFRKFFTDQNIPEEENIEPVIVQAVDNSENEKISWEDLDWIKSEKARSGPGEHGEEYIETDPEEIKKNEKWMEIEGFYVEVSNKISLNRSLSDRRASM